MKFLGLDTDDLFDCVILLSNDLWLVKCLVRLLVMKE